MNETTTTSGLDVLIERIDREQSAARPELDKYLWPFPLHQGENGGAR